MRIYAEETKQKLSELGIFHLNNALKWNNPDNFSFQRNFFPLNSKFREYHIILNLKFSVKLIPFNPFIFATWIGEYRRYVNLRFFWFTRIYSLKYPRSLVLGCQNLWIRKSEFEAKTQFHWGGWDEGGWIQ